MRYSGTIKLYIHIDADDSSEALQNLHIRASEIAEEELKVVPDIYEVEPDTVWKVEPYNEESNEI